MKKILLIEDEEIIRQSLRRLLEKNLYIVTEAGSVNEAVNQMNDDSFDLIITDLRLPDDSGERIIALAENTPVLVMTSYASIKSAVDSIKLGAKNYIAKPFNHTELIRIVNETLSESSFCFDHTNQSSNNNGPTTTDVAPDIKQYPEMNQLKYPNEFSEFSGIFGQCPAMLDTYKKIEKVARTKTTVLILGESGTGKELVAKAIHQTGHRANGELISVNCAAIPQALIESELFGHENGAFTGASTSRKGLVEAADGGTLFLDEVGELPLEAQARLLRLLQEKEFRKVGSTQSHTIDIRLVAATHRNLKRLAATGQFREDLYYRLQVIELQLPPLRERGDDILALAHFFLEKLRKKNHCFSDVRFSNSAISAIKYYRWPGNVRELENAIERALILCDSSEINPETLGIPTPEQDNSLLDEANISQFEQVNFSPGTNVKSENRALSLEDYFQRFVLENQNQMTETQIARKLGISRKCLWERRQRLGIPRSKGKQTGLCSQ